MASTTLMRLTTSWAASMGTAVRSYVRGPFSLKDRGDAELWNTLLNGGGDSSAGVVVTDQNAFMFSAVFDAVSQQAADVAKVPCELLKRVEGGGSEPYLDAKAYWLLKLEPNPEMDDFEFRRTLTAHALTGHGGYAEIERDILGRPIALWPLTPDRVEPVRERVLSANGRYEWGPLRYRIDGERILDAMDVLHIHGLGYDGICGYSLINLARQAIGIALSAEQFVGGVFKQGRFGGILSTDTDLDDEQQAAVKASIQTYKKGFEQFLVLFGQAWKYDKTGISPQEAGMDSIRDQQVQAVANFFNMPLHRLKVNKPGAVSYASVEAADRAYYLGPIYDWAVKWEKELNRKLIPRTERRQQYFKHNLNAFMRGDTAARSAFYSAMLDRGVFNADMVLAFEDMNPQPNGQGQAFLVQGAQVPKDQLIRKTEAEIEKLKADAQPDPPTPPAPTPDPTADDGTRDRVAALEAALEHAQRGVGEAERAAHEARERLAAAEATGQTRAEEIARLESRVTAADGVVAARHAECVGLSAELAEARATLAQLRTQLETLEVTAADALARADAADADRNLRIAEALEATEQAQAARHAREAAEAEAREADTAVVRAEAERSQAVADAAAALARAAETERAARAAEAEAVQAAVAATTAAEAARAEADAATQRALDAQAEVDAARLLTEAERAAKVEAEQARDAAVTEASQHRDAHAAVVAERDAIAAALAAEREANRAQRLATLAAHRGLIIDAIGRMTRREGQQARAKQATPEKLRRWLDGFTEMHEALCVEALLPAVRVHLAWKGAPEDPLEVTTALVRDHLALFTQRVSVALQSDADEFHAVLDRILTRWESDRAAAVADAFLLEAMTHVQTQ